MANQSISENKNAVRFKGVWMKKSLNLSAKLIPKVYTVIVFSYIFHITNKVLFYIWGRARQIDIEKMQYGLGLFHFTLQV